MGSKRAKKCVSKGINRVDREQQIKNQFDLLRLEVKYPGTAILLLQCKEKPILLAASAALAKFGAKSEENLEVLFNLEIVDSVLPLITHEDLFTRRFAAKLLAEMAVIPNVRYFLLDFNYYIPHFIKVLINEEDMFMQEFSSLILAEISTDVFGAAQLLKQCSDMNFLFERIQSPDPDVKKNIIQIMYNLLQDPLGAQEIIMTKDFDMQLIYKLFNSSYLEIQKLALDVIADFVRRNKNEYLHDHFRRTNGLQALLQVLEKREWEDIHKKVLKILCLACDNVTTVELLDDIGGIKQILKYTEDTSNSKLFMEAFDLAVCLSQTPKGRKVILVWYNFRGSNTSSENVIIINDSSSDVFKNEKLKWPVRQAALFALKQLLRCNISNCQNFLNIQGQNYLLSLMKQTVGKVPIEILVGVVESFIIIARNLALRRSIISTDLIDTLSASFELTCKSMNDFKVICCTALSILCTEKFGRQEFLKTGRAKRLYNLLCDIGSIPVRNAVVQLIQSLCVDPILADAFVKARYLHYMLKNRLIARVVPSWNTCIEALFDSHLSLKFALTGRLSFHNVTEDGFYVLRRNVCSFPILDDILKFKFCPLEPIYVVNCIRPRQSSLLEEECDRLSLQEPSILSIDSKRIFLSTEIRRMTMESRFGRLQCDSHLYDYIELFKCNLIAAESKNVVSKTRQGLVNINYIASRAKMLGKFVAQQMSGPDPLINCIDHQLEIHLKEIKKSIGTSVIPLGMLRVGSYFERALLFKVIADRVYLPAALVRGEYGKAWIEIAVPEVKSSVEEDSFYSYIHRDITCPEIITIHEPVQYPPESGDQTGNDIIPEQDQYQSVFPTKLLKPNFIVDLMECPGDLIPVNSCRARLYCEKRLTCIDMCQNI
ncbi:PREDICTED: armadillo repeat-containing protein 3 [Habropoda laboriosa]|uniref:armadillo repeat-containing protein 3 n=1 Tax=Habropoda laboriosa TaxID=597456 RepID=UPI00083E2234|nr:PREDICTED: armadillo repeat-containing protein 3 [Habropoda laboriosa]